MNDILMVKSQQMWYISIQELYRNLKQDKFIYMPHFIHNVYSKCFT